MTFIIPNQSNDWLYMCKNPHASDVSAALKEWATGSIGADTYKILEYASEHTFDVGTEYAEQLTMQELEIALLSIAFWDLVGELNTPATHMAAHAKYRPFAQNDQNTCFLLLDDLKVHLHYVIGNPTFPTDAQIHTMYNNTLQPLVIDLSVGDVAAAADFLSGQTGAGLAAATGLGTAAEWDQLLTHVDNMVDPFLKKFPR